MSEFWALVLGSGLGIIGGVFGAIINEIISRRRTLLDSRRAVYEDLLIDMQTASTPRSDSEKKDNDFKERVIREKCRIYLYGSEMIKEQYNDFVRMLMVVNSSDKKEQEKLLGMIEIIAAQMRKEMGLHDKTSKRILKDYGAYKKGKKKRMQKMMSKSDTLSK